MKTANRNRVLLIILAVLVMSSAVGARLYYLQVSMCEDFRKCAASQGERQITVDATRGSILDRHGRELAVSLATESLYAHPRKVSRPEVAADLLAPVLGLDRGEILDRLRSDRRFDYLQRFMEPEQAELARSLELPSEDAQAFGLLPSSKRYYPRGKLAVHVVGFADIDGRGLEGIERTYDEQLRGDPLIYLVQQDGRNDRYGRVITAAGKKPRNVVLTVDSVLQHIAERELDRAMGETGSRAASAVIMDPQTGQILALANRPAADPNRYGRSSPAARVNRAAVHQFEPGSTFKIVTMASALEQKAIRPDQWFDCENGVYALGSRRVRDTTPHGSLSARQIIQKSSNIGMIKISMRLDRQELWQTISDFGFGRQTGIELPGELNGRLRPVSEWSNHSTASLAFGYEVGVTVLQMTSALSVIANDGLLVPPRIVLGISDAGNRLERSAAPAARRVVSPGTAREIASMLEGVIIGGTGTRAEVAGYRLAGKSGTARKYVDGGYSDNDYIASFGGFGPLRSPRLLCMVVIDTPRGKERYGGHVAAPVFRRIMADALRHLRIPADREIRIARGGASTEPRRVPIPDRVDPAAILHGTVPDLRGLSAREAVAHLARAGCSATVEGKGTVAAQHPAAGSPVKPGQTCRLSLRETESTSTARRAEASRS